MSWTVNHNDGMRMERGGDLETTTIQPFSFLTFLCLQASVVSIQNTAALLVNIAQQRQSQPWHDVKARKRTE